MGIGTSIALIAIGAILAFAVDFEIGGLDIDVVGYVLIAAGVLGLLFVLLLQRRSTGPDRTHTEREVVRDEPVEREREVVRERPADDDTRRDAGA